MSSNEPREKALTRRSNRGPVVVTGATGFVGLEVCRLLGERACPLSHQQLDIADADALEATLEEVAPAAIINAAAAAQVDFCEEHPEEAYRANALGPRLLGEACAGRGIKLIHVSTDYVFGANGHALYQEEDPPEPVNEYGRSKALGEQWVREACKEAIVARTAWVYGPVGRGFGCTVPARLRVGDRVDAITDRYGHPTFVTDLASRLLELLLVDEGGICHVVNQGPTSWYEFALTVARRLGCPEAQVRPVSRLQLPPAAPRPVRVSLRTGQSSSCPFPPLRPWQEALEAFLSRLP